MTRHFMLSGGEQKTPLNRGFMVPSVRLELTLDGF